MELDEEDDDFLYADAMHGDEKAVMFVVVFVTFTRKETAYSQHVRSRYTNEFYMKGVFHRKIFLFFREEFQRF